MEAYCVKCKTKREITEAEATFTKQAVAATRGVCGVCGTKVFRMGRTPAHEGLTPPVVVSKKSKKAPPRRSGNLVIVESPAKAKTIGRYLGKGYKVKASMGHVRDLLRSQLSVDVDNNYQPKYRVPNERRDTIKELKADVQKAKLVYLATDLDREGEAIAWHLMEATELEPERAKRVKFDEITPDAIKAAFDKSTDLDMNLVNAQQARRILDRLVGYSLSPLLWAKVRGRLSAGRVQSVAVRLIVEREREIDNFNPTEYWSIGAMLDKLPGAAGKHKPFLARLRRVGKKTVGMEKDVPLGSEAEVLPILADLEKANWHVGKVKRGERQRRPSAPFTTSTLQQEAARKLNFTTRRTMAIAQQLYEGIDVGAGEPVGLITYMRTDSVSISKQAQGEAKDYVVKRFGKGFVPAEPPEYKTRAKSAQEAHEAIRPTSVLRDPAAIKDKLSRDQFRLYQLVWQRFLASQMSNAVYDTLSVDIMANNDAEYTFRASGSYIKFQGFLIVYEEAVDEDAVKKQDEDTGAIPPLDEQEVLGLNKLLPEQHFTQPPPRFTEASLVRALEEHGIGRPSTYAPIISTVQNRGYVTREDKRLYPTETGMVVNDLLVDHFANVLEMGFTAEMESNLDKVASGEREWQPLIHEFYAPFSAQVEVAREKMPKVAAEPEKVGRACPKCEHDLIVRFGRYGKFIGCSDFPNCRHIEPWLEKIGVSCPNDKGEIVERKTKKGRIFYGCANYPECEWNSWKKPLPTPCPNCQGLLIIKNRQEAICDNCENRYPLGEVTPEKA